jgi:hypothetical protein
MGFNYTVVHYPSIKKRDVFLMRERGEIELDPRWEKQFNEWVIK